MTRDFGLNPLTGRRYFSDRIFAGANAQLRAIDGRTLLAADAETSQWQHPWQVRCAFRAGQWRATVRPGFVNGRDATIAMQIDGEEVHVALTDDPRPHLVITAWRNPLQASGISATAQGDLIATAGEGYPKFFDRLGVKLPAKGGRITQLGALEATADRFRTREIRAADLALTVPRLATRSDVTVLDPTLDAASIRIDTAFVNDSVRRNAASPFRVYSTPLWRPPLEPTMLERLEGTAVEPQTDELKIATVWMLSPPDAAADAEPDATWTPYPQHFLFWNVMHASRRQQPTAPPPPLTFPYPLAGGVAQPLISGLLSPTNDAFAKIAAYFGAANYKGEFWTV